MTPLLDLIARTGALLSDPVARQDMPAVARALGATVDNRAEGTGFLGSDPVPGCYAIDVQSRDREVDDVVLRLSVPVPLADFAARFGPYQVPAVVSGHRLPPQVRFTLAGATLVATLDESETAVVEVLLRPAG